MVEVVELRTGILRPAPVGLGAYDSDDDAVIATNAQQINSDTIVASVVEDFIQEDLVKVVFVVFNKASSSSRITSASAAW